MTPIPSPPSAPPILILGAGAIGSTLALALSPRRRVVIGDPDPAVRAAWAARGLETLDPRTELATFPVERGTLALVATRATVAEAALAQLPRALTALCLCNGLNERLTTCRDGPTLFGVVDFAATCDTPGHPRQTQRGTLTMPAESPEDSTRRLAADLEGSPIHAHLADDITGHLWSKLILNSSLDPVAALSGRTLGGVFAHRPSFLTMRRLLREGVLVAKSAGIRLQPVQGTSLATMVAAFHAPLINRFAAATAARKARAVDSTMTADLRAGRTTEIRFLCGSILAVAERTGASAPTHQAILAQIEHR